MRINIFKPIDAAIKWRHHQSIKCPRLQRRISSLAGYGIERVGVTADDEPRGGVMRCRPRARRRLLIEYCTHDLVEILPRISRRTMPP